MTASVRMDPLRLHPLPLRPHLPPLPLPRGPRRKCANFESVFTCSSGAPRSVTRSFGTQLAKSPPNSIGSSPPCAPRCLPTSRTSHRTFHPESSLSAIPPRRDPGRGSRPAFGARGESRRERGGGRLLAARNRPRAAAIAGAGAPTVRRTRADPTPGPRRRRRSVATASRWTRSGWRRGC